MVVEIILSCSACHIMGKRTPLKGLPSTKIVIDGTGALLELCPTCRLAIIAPIEKLLEEWGRPVGGPADNGGGIVPAGVPTDRRDRGGSPVGGRKGNGGARPGSGPAPKGTHILCLVSSCGHRMGTHSGLLYHLRHSHDLNITQCFNRVKACGLCGAECNGSAKLGLHAKSEHKLTGGAELLAKVREAGDPRRSLARMDSFIRQALNPPASAPDNGQLSITPDVTESEEPSHSEAS